MNQTTKQPDGDDVALLTSASERLRELETMLARVVVGQDTVIRAMLTAVLAEGHVLLIGVPGLAKTLLVRTLADALDWSFRRIQFTPDMMPADVIGTELLQDDPAHGHRRMQFMPGPIFTHLLLADEINRTPPKTQSALLEAMQEYTVTSMGVTHPLERPFIVIATQNPIEQEGTYPLPEAQLDRFMFSLRMTYPSAVSERDIVMTTTGTPAARVKPCMSRAALIEVQRLVRRLPVTEYVADYAVAIARATRPSPQMQEIDFVRRYVAWGAGTRAAQSMVLAGKAMALLQGEPTVTPVHVREVAPHVLRHRVLTNFAAAGEGVTVDDVIERAITVADEAMSGA